MDIAFKIWFSLQFADVAFNNYSLFYKARFKRRILHAPNRIAKLSACKMRRLNQLNATYFTGSPSSKYVVYAAAYVYRELCGKIADRKKNA